METTSKGGNGARGGGSASYEEQLSELAHQFRTPLGVITGYVELLRLRDDPALRADALPRIEEAAHRLSQTIDRLVSVLESDQSDLAQRFLEARAIPSGASRSSGVPGVALGFRDRTGRDATRVVVVDDDDEIRQLLLRTLPTDGFEILEARDGDEALGLVEHMTPDVVVLDWNMPNVSGGDVLEELARRERKVPVIVLTADDDPRRRAIAEAHGADAFLAKPFSPLELLREIERLLA